MRIQQQFYRSWIWFIDLDRFKEACNDSSLRYYITEVWRVLILIQPARATWTTDTWTTWSYNTPRGREESSMQENLFNVRKRVVYTIGIH